MLLERLVADREADVTRFPVTSAQRRLWLQHEMAPSSASYIMSAAVRLRGPFDLETLRQALAAITERHEALRTTFDAADGIPLQYVHGNLPIPLSVREPLAAGGGIPHAELRETAAEPFDLRRGPLARATVWRLAPDDHVLLLTMHHIVADAWSVPLLMQDLAACYRAAQAGQTAALPPLRVQCADYAVWEAAELAGPAMESHLTYWRSVLADLPPRLDLPADHVPGPRLRAPAGVVRGRLDASVVSALRSIALDRQATLFMLMHAVFAAVLSRFTGARDLIVGIPVSGRVRRETGGVVGCFINTLPLRTRLADDPTVADLLAEVRRGTLGALEHQLLPVDKLVEELRIPRASGRDPLFDVAFSVQPRAEVGDLLDGTRGEAIGLDPVEAKFDLSCLVEDDGTALRITWEYRTDLLAAATVESMAACYTAMLGEVAADPARPLSALALSAAAEPDCLVSPCGAGPWTVTEVFRRTAARSPDRPAIRDGDAVLTYGELDRLTNRIARALRSRGAGPEAPVAVCLPRSAGFAVACLAILKAGGSYVPLDPGYPPERLRHMINEAGAEHVVTRSDLVDRLGDLATAGLALLLVDDPSAWAGETDEDPRAPVHPESLCLRVFTSGSTGEPKAVGVTHRGVVNLVMPGDYCGLGPGQTILWLCSVSFDAASWDMWGTLLHGAYGVIQPERAYAAAQIGQAIAGHGATMAVLTTALFHAVADEDVHALRGLRTLIVGGEAMSAAHVRRVAAAVAGLQVINVYGPAENATIATCFAVPRDFAAASAVPIGAAVNGTRVALRDLAGRPVPFGAVGEIWLGGPNVARGYVGRPGLTAERFVPGPDGSRWYRTGDLGRRVASGALVFRGRTDAQVKIRGHRVEPGEVEAVLARHPAVARAVVTAHRVDAVERRLAAHIVADGPLSARDVHTWARTVLPDYMVPAAINVLEVMPLTRNGKVDTAALPAPDWSFLAAGARGSREPALAEAAIAAIWADLLDLDAAAISPDDDFFALGGHSLLASRLVSRLARVLGVEVSLEEVFDCPTLAALADLAGARSPAARRPPPLRPASRPARLSFAQERLWFLTMLDPEPAVYNIPLALRLTGNLDVAALARALRWLLRRHEILRTVIERSGDGLVQVASPADGACIDLPVVDVAHADAAMADALAARALTVVACRPFDLARGELPVRALLVRNGPAEHVFVLVVHHIAADGWSVSVLAEELGSAYAAFLDGRAPEAADPLIQYADYAQWQRDEMSGDALAGQAAFWRRRLRGAPQVLDLPTDHPRPARRRFGGELRPFALSPELTEGVRRVAKAAGCTEYMVLLAAFCAVLARWSGQDELLVGSPVAGRSHPDVERSIGCFANTLVLRADVSGDPSVTDLLARVRRTCLDAYSHQDMPFEKLVEDAEPERDLARAPLVQVMLGFDNTPPPTLDLPGLRVAPVRIDNPAARFDLTLWLADARGAAGGIGGSCEYDTALFEPGTITAFLDRLRRTIAGFVADPGRRLADVTAPDAAESSLLARWGSGPPIEAVPPLPVPEQIRRWARDDPERTAVSDPAGGQWSYARLWQHARRVAAQLRAAGAGLDSVVGVCAGRTPETVAALLGVWLAGAAYVPLDPGLPDARLRLIAERAGLTLALADPVGAPHVPRGLRVAATVPDPAYGRVPDGPAATPPGAAAYLLFTSGSTGEPKGVVVPHAALSTFLHAMVAIEPGMAEADHLVAVTTLSFDIAALELFGPLVAGARLTIATDAHARDGRLLARLIDDCGCTVLQATPVTWRLLLEAGWRPPPGFRALCGGEPLPPELARDLLASGVRLWNLYGPTETTVWSTAGEVTDPQRIGLGAPIAGTQVAVRDGRGDPTMPGGRGEIWIGGAGVARGYAGSPALTAERFVPAPDGKRWYRTGDLARYGSDGLLAYCGRADAQLKVRGHRIEPGEVEAEIARHPAVARAAVIARDGALVAYYTPACHETIPIEDATAAGEETFAAELRAAVRATLPSYMVPEHVVRLANLPLTRNGKIDRAALAALAPPAGSTAAAGHGAHGAIEDVIAATWADVLNVRGEAIGISADFFALGGHSLHAAQVASLMGATLGMDIAVRTMFERPTIAGLAAWIRAGGSAGSGETAVPVRMLAGDGPFPLSPAQERLWFLAQYDPDSPAYNVPVAARVTGSLSLPALRRAVDFLVDRHEALRTSFSTRDGFPTQRVLDPETGRADIRMADVSGLPDRTTASLADRIVRRIAFQPFDLAGGAPPLRVVLVRQRPQEHTLCLVVHHILADGWAISVLLNDLCASYTAFAQGRMPDLGPLPLRHTDHAAWQRQMLDTGALDGAIEQRRSGLVGAPQTLDLPADHPRPPRRRHRGATMPLTIPDELTAQVRALARRAGCTEFMVLLAAFAAALARYCGQDDLLIGTPVAGRTQPGTENLVGLLANTLVIRADLSGDPTVHELLTRVRRACLDAYDSERVPLEKLVDELAPQRDPSRTPLFQVMIALNNTAPPSLALPGLTVEPVQPDNPTAKFDVVLNLLDTPTTVTGGCEYDTDVYSPEMISKLLGHFRLILTEFAAGPDRPLSHINILSTAEQESLLGDFNRTVAGYDPRTCLHRLVEAQVDATPDAVAVSMAAEPGAGRVSLTYAQLDSAANQLARRMIRFGVQVDDIVGVCASRSLAAVIAQFAVLKAGAAFLPLDPAHPPARLAGVLADARARLVLVEPRHAEVLPAQPPRLPLDQACWSAQSQDRPDVAAVPGNLAYVVYTSGSTGTPRGVQIEHRAICNNLLWMQQDWPLGQGDRMLHKTTTTFDVAVKEVFWPLLSGAELVLARPGSQRDPEYLADLIEAAGITITHFVPSMLDLVLEVLEARGHRFGGALRYVMSGAETLPVTIQERFFRRADADLLHMYGPTETAIAVTGWTCRRAERRDRVPLGRPMPHVQLYVVDSHDQPVPAGVWGELLVGGAALGRGYLGRPVQTARAFIPDPFSATRGGRLYRTGDIVRHGRDGLLEFRGRIDGQVKVRGFRIELGEVEAALGAQPDVRQAAATLRGDAGSARLIGYVVAAPGCLIDPAELRRRLGTRLPEYMVPAVVVVLDALPLGENAKVDRGALPDPGADRPDGGGQFTAPRDDMEHAVAGAWSQALGTAPIGAHDDFFALGGNSLQAARVAMRLRERFGCELQLRDFFADPTVEGVARLLGAAGRATTIRRQARAREDRSGIRSDTGGAQT